MPDNMSQEQEGFLLPKGSGTEIHKVKPIREQTFAEVQGALVSGNVVDPILRSEFLQRRGQLINKAKDEGKFQTTEARIIDALRSSEDLDTASRNIMDKSVDLDDPIEREVLRVCSMRMQLLSLRKKADQIGYWDSEDSERAADLESTINRASFWEFGLSPEEHLGRGVVAPGEHAPSQPQEIRIKFPGRIELGADRQYASFQDNEYWCKVPMGRLDREHGQMPSYVEGMTDRELDEIDARRELLNAVNFKRYALMNSRDLAPNLDSLAKNAALAGIDTRETEILMRIPGAWSALVQYVRLVDDNIVVDSEGVEFRKAQDDQGLTILTRTDNGQTFTLDGNSYRSRDGEVKDVDDCFTLREAADDNQIGRYRDYVRRLVKNPVARGYGQRGKFEGIDRGSRQYANLVDVYSRDAEQIAFNLHYAANFFEGQDSIWERQGKITRDRKGEEKRKLTQVVRRRAIAGGIGAKTINFPIRNAMKPLDNLIKSTLRVSKKEADVGAFGKHAYEQTQRSLRRLDPRIRKDYQMKDYDEVVVLPSTKANAKKFWTVENVGSNTHPQLRLYAFEAYAHDFLSDAWSETRVGDKSLLDYMREVSRSTSDQPNLPFDEPRMQSFWGAYLYKVGKQAKIWDYLQGKSPINFGRGGGGGPQEWVDDVNETLQVFGLREDSRIKRAILYASIGIKPNKRAPQLRTAKMSVLRLICGSHKYMDKNKALYPWDQPSLLDLAFF